MGTEGEVADALVVIVPAAGECGGQFPLEIDAEAVFAPGPLLGAGEGLRLGRDALSDVFEVGVPAVDDVVASGVAGLSVDGEGGHLDRHDQGVVH
ncbi:hypothetical protein RB199_11445 [Streptomyces libani]